ncbi:hypothetical protein G6F43_014480 [Rhizopus delemar]|nr:hypothetical protein G6F43_014480 [Rhizopus delemar]
MTRKPNMLVFVELVTIVLPSNKPSIMSILGYLDDLHSLATLHMSLERARQVPLKHPTLPFEYVQSNIKTLPRKRRMSHGAIASTSKH